MGEVVVLPVIRAERATSSDGGKARIKGRRAALNLSEPSTADDLRMDHVDATAPPGWVLPGIKSRTQG